MENKLKLYINLSTIMFILVFIAGLVLTFFGAVMLGLMDGTYADAMRELIQTGWLTIIGIFALVIGAVALALGCVLSLASLFILIHTYWCSKRDFDQYYSAYKWNAIFKLIVSILSFGSLLTAFQFEIMYLAIQTYLAVIIYLSYNQYKMCKDAINGIY